MIERHIRNYYLTRRAVEWFRKLVLHVVSSGLLENVTAPKYIRNTVKKKPTQGLSQYSMMPNVPPLLTLSIPVKAFFSNKCVSLAFSPYVERHLNYIWKLPVYLKLFQYFCWHGSSRTSFRGPNNRANCSHCESQDILLASVGSNKHLCLVVPALRQYAGSQIPPLFGI